MYAHNRKYLLVAQKIWGAATHTIALLSCSLFFTLNAHGELANKENPVDVRSDRVTVNEAKQESLFEGNVVATQGTLVIRGDRMLVKQDANGFQYGTTYGNPANFKQKLGGANGFTKGSAERVEYDTKADKIRLFSNAQIKRGNDTVSGDYISYDMTSEHLEIDGKTPTKDKPTPNRVRAEIQLKSKK